MTIVVEIEVPDWAKWIVYEMDGLWVYEREPYKLTRKNEWRVKSGQSDCLAENIQCELPYNEVIPISRVMLQEAPSHDH